MATETAFQRAQRFALISWYLCQHTGGLTCRELAERCGVTTRTIQRDLRALEELGASIYKIEGFPPRYALSSGSFLPPLKLDMDEALALYISARLLARHSDRCDPYTLRALKKLGSALPPPMAEHIERTTAMLRSNRPEDPQVQALCELARGWAFRRTVRVLYQSASADAATWRRVDPYFIEPSAVSYAVYVIGRADPPGEVRTFKVERVLKAELTDERFQVPEDFDPLALLDSAWGIMYGEEEVEVQLRFAPEAVRRLRENLWHPTQQLVELIDGSCLFTVRVAHPDEMLYWIRGWGPLVEVLSPPELRERIREDARKLCEMYGG